LTDRADVVSSFTAIKGTMLEETYAVFQRWDLHASKRENLDQLREDNYIAASSGTWLRDVAKVINRRYDPGHWSSWRRAAVCWMNGARSPSGT
jgi:hypothetical protein